MRHKLWFCLIMLGLFAGCQESKHQYQGYIEGDTLYLAKPFSGTLQKMYVYRGQKVKKDQLLFELDPNPQQFSLAQAVASLEQGQQLQKDLEAHKRQPEIDAVKAQIAQVDAELVLAALRVKRNKILYDKHVVGLDTLDAAVEHLHEVQALREQQEANLALSLLGGPPNLILAQAAANDALQAVVKSQQWSVNQKRIYAPSAGVIFDTYYKTGEFVSAERPIASLLTQKNTYIEFFVPQRDLHDLTLRRQITFNYPQSKEKYHAIIAYISPIAEYMPPLVYSRDNFDKIVFRIKAMVKDKIILTPGQPVTVTVEHVV